MAEKAGTRYGCTTCAAVVVVVKTSDGELQCHGQPMKVLS
jgi:desulfoferrodoxin-like iron-binding protein